MSYNAEINRHSPTCFLFLIDQSGSMRESWGQSSRAPKAEALATIINRLLHNLVIKCAKSEGVRDYFWVGVLGYGLKVVPAFSGEMAGRELVPISAVADSPVRIEERVKRVSDGVGGLVDQTVKFPVWFEPVARGGTPMCRALEEAHNTLAPWVAEHQESFPPVVINITDGESTDGDPSAAAQKLRGLSTQDGNALLFNIHISSAQGDPIEYPANNATLPDKFASMLFGMSSVLPPFMREIACEEGKPLADKARGFVFNANMESVTQFLDIGTRPGHLR